ncbi:type II toxin-antitoxin system RelE/ParE family toxin [Flavobacterium ajazii]|uniref:type II toxin-antitoxin system RelE/ParE family toxin n=1 Tax=Flavobacterium ajazii TaxID=2692318 RepID=UPI0013D6DA3B|nr:type II toxin-antitoxin system RelE/ParE family toxin [Flavobacterium ajazii]
MKIRLQEEFLLALDLQVDYISKDKPAAARKFKNDLLRNIEKDLKNPFYFKKSRYFNNEMIRDYIFKGYVIVYFINEPENFISVFGFIKHKYSL